ncbi:MAG TPA: hypothetical protein EYQ20_00375 [candidate division Zixibacteria bacterium]|nr:hypothetical protein [candidate division Zixibacteria bacterium]
MGRAAAIPGRHYPRHPCPGDAIGTQGNEVSSGTFVLAANQEKIAGPAQDGCLGSDPLAHHLIWRRHSGQEYQFLTFCHGTTPHHPCPLAVHLGGQMVAQDHPYPRGA